MSGIIGQEPFGKSGVIGAFSSKGIDDNADANAITIDSAGHITMPLQSAASADFGTINNITGDSTNWPGGASAAASISVTERFDNNADMTGAKFTAPVTGKYQLSCMLNVINLGTDHNYGYFGIQTSNAGYTLAQSYDWHQWFHVNSGGSFVAAPAGSILADMDANDEAYIYFGIYGGTKVVSIDNGYLTAILLA